MFCNDCVVDYSAFLIQEDRQCWTIWMERRQRRRGQPFQKLRSCRASEAVKGQSGWYSNYVECKAHLDWTICPTSNKPASLRTWLWLATEMIISQPRRWKKPCKNLGQHCRMPKASNNQQMVPSLPRFQDEIHKGRFSATDYLLTSVVLKEFGVVPA